MNEAKRYLAKCLDPVHIGAGGYQLGRVDMTIVREPATGIPKIPGTSLAGALRAYAELAKEEDPSLPEICAVFGDDERQGMIRFYDADVVLFPENSDQGTIWISTSDRLTVWIDPSGKVKGPGHDEKAVSLKGLPNDGPINLGWLLIDTEPAARSDLNVPAHLEFISRLVMVSDKLFHHLVNDNLEVRTSVQIDDTTGAAKSGQLFTYEAIPRGTVLGFEVAIDDRRGNGIQLEGVNRLLQRAFQGLKLLGIGGMGTRGFGRLEVLRQDERRSSEES
jgi:CRISPR-associated protein Cmr4